MFPIMNMLHENKSSLGSKLKILKYEDLVDAPEKNMRELSSWLGVRFNKSLLIPTRIGKATRSDSAFSSGGVSGISHNSTHRWRSEMRSTEIRMVEYLFGSSMEDLDYRILHTSGFKDRLLGFLCCFLPWKGEIFPHKKILKRKDKGRNKYAVWRYFKYIVFLSVNL